MDSPFDPIDSDTLDLYLRQITDVSTNSASFWSAAHGWAPREAADLLSQARLDWLASLSRTLSLRVREVSNHPSEPGVIIVAWAHLRALVEGHLKLFLAVWLNTYLSDPNAKIRKGKVIQPDELSYELIR